MTTLLKRIRHSGTLSRLRYGRLSRLTSALSFFDDFNWRNYTKDSYRQSILAKDPDHTTRLREVEFLVKHDLIQLPAGAKPLHPADRLIYETALRLKPESVFECGFGCGDHLLNLKTVMPHINIAGADIGETQKEFALQRNPSLKNAVLEVLDLTIPNIAGARRADFVYSNAVVMHIQRGDRHREFLRNMVVISNRYVFLRENWRRHNFVRDLRGLFPELNVYLVRGQDRLTGLLLDKRNSAPFEIITSDLRLFSLERD